MKVMKEFKEFLAEYKITGLAIAFIIGAALVKLVTSLVNDIIMPLINPALAVFGKDWQTWTVWVFSIGKFLGSVVEFLIIALVVFLIAKYLLKEEKVSKK